MANRRLLLRWGKIVEEGVSVGKGARRDAFAFEFKGGPTQVKLFPGLRRDASVDPVGPCDHAARSWRYLPLKKRKFIASLMRLESGVRSSRVNDDGRRSVISGWWADEEPFTPVFVQARCRKVREGSFPKHSRGPGGV